MKSYNALKEIIAVIFGYKELLSSIQVIIN